MNSNANWVRKVQHVKLPGFNEEFYQCIETRLNQLKAIETPTYVIGKSKCKRAKKMSCPNFSVGKEKMPMSCKLIRIVDHSEMVAIRKVFGSTFATGVKKKAPRLNDEVNPAMLLNSDKVRMVQCPHASTHVRTNKKHQLRISHLGLDIVHEKSSSGVPLLKFTIRFEEFFGNDDQVRAHLLGSGIESADGTDGGTETTGSGGAEAENGPSDSVSSAAAPELDANNASSSTVTGNCNVDTSAIEFEPLDEGTPFTAGNGVHYETMEDMTPTMDTVQCEDLDGNVVRFPVQDVHQWALDSARVSV